MEIENDMQITYHKFLIKICNELFINGNDHEKALKILTNSLSTLDNDELVPQILSLICKILYTSSASNEKVKLKSVSICTPEKRTPPSLLFATPSARIEKFLKSRTPGLTPATKFKIYTPKTEKINRLPVKSDDNERILTPKPKKSLRKVDDSIKKDANKARKNILGGDNKNMDLTLEINKNDTNSSHNGNELWSIQTGDVSNIKTPTTNKFFKHLHDFSDTYKSKTEKINRLPSKSKIKLPTIQYSDVYDQIHSPEQKKSVRKVYKSIKKGAIKALQSDSTDSSSEVLDLDGDDDVFTINNNKTPCTNKFFKSRTPGSILTYKKKIHTPKTEKIDRLSIESDNKLPTFTNSEDIYRTPESKNSIRKIKKKQITEGITNLKVNDKEKVVSSNSTENDSTDLSSEKTDLDGDDDVSIKVIKTCLDTKIKNDIGKNKQVRNKSAVKSQTGDFCATSIDICDNLAVNKCLNYKHTYSKSSVNDHLSEQLSNLKIEQNSEMTHSSPAKQKIKPKTATKRNTTKEEEKDEHNSEIESRRMLTRRAKKMESLELMETETNNDNKSLEKSSVDVPSPKVQKKIVKTTTKKVSKAKLKPNSSPNSSESVSKPRRKPKNPFIL
ncbi:uncharacterized protein LOC123298179 [Chrysoperla carnea]|uniref:uncharacterized protein LOC123298179 n=1 Tax=Chrysoperla carnea TaxID=189513 RepID=UPI001D0862F5|nr:uncharacterized protein LOC123298179 [Chrysoperla carnea]